MNLHAILPVANIKSDSLQRPIDANRITDPCGFAVFLVPHLNIMTLIYFFVIRLPFFYYYYFTLINSTILMPY